MLVGTRYVAHCSDINICTYTHIYRCELRVVRCYFEVAVDFLLQAYLSKRRKLIKLDTKSFFVVVVIVSTLENEKNRFFE